MELVELSIRLTISITMTMSQEALTMYIFQPMLARPIGMMKTKTSLDVVSKSIRFIQGRETHARRFNKNDEKARPFARIE